MQQSVHSSTDVPLATSPRQTDHQAPLNATRVVLVLVTLSIVIPLVVFALGLKFSYNSHLERDSGVLTRISERIQSQTAKSFANINAVGKEVSSNLSDLTEQKILADEVNIRNRFKSMLAGVDEIDAISILNRNGQILLSTSISPDIENMNLFEGQRDESGDLAYVSKVLPSGDRKKSFLQFSWPRRNASGDIIGM